MRRSRLTAAAVLLAVVLAGCSDDPEPKRADPTDEPPETTSNSSPTTPSTSTPPEPETAEAFLRRWQATGDEMQRTGDSSEYEVLNRGCNSCDTFVDAVEQIYADGGFVEFDGTEITELTERASTRQAATYDLGIRSSATLIHDADDSTPSRVPPEAVTLRVTLVPQGPSWLVTSFSKLPQ